MGFWGHELAREMVNPLYMAERALNVGHIDLHQINVASVINQVANLLEMAGESPDRINELRDLAGEPDRSYTMRFGAEDSNIPQSFADSMAVIHNVDLDKSNVNENHHAAPIGLSRN
jgi:hypothetical protein